MKKLLVSLTMLAALGMNAAAYFDGNITGTTGPGGYKGTKLDLTIGSGKLDIQPSMASYASDKTAFGGDTYRTYALRAAWEAEKYTIAGLAGATPVVNNYSNKFFGGDLTLTLTPGGGGHSRLVGPGSRPGSGGGEGVSRIDIGAAFKYTQHTQAQLVGADKKTDQTEGSLFAGAKILMVNLSASYTAYKYGAKDATLLINPIPGQGFAYNAMPNSSVNVKLDLPAQTLLTPFISYTSTKYEGTVKDSHAYLVGAYIDLNMITANVGYQIFNDGNTNTSYITLGAGVKFE